MAIAEATRGRKRVLLVSDDDTFSAELKPRLPGIDVLSLTESSVWLASRAGLDVTRGVNAVLVDHQVSGRLQMGLYETLRPSDGVAQVPVIFTRSKLTAATAGFAHELDVYQQGDASAAQTALLVADVLGYGPRPAPRPTAQPQPEGIDEVSIYAAQPPAPHAEHAAARPGRPARRMERPARFGLKRGRPGAGVAERPRAAATGPGMLQRLALWGIASALIGFTFWPLFGSGPVREAVFGPLRALSGGSGEVANVGNRLPSTP
jgi:hypothetical protein